MKKCPYCAEKIQDEAVVCRYCGKELPKAEVDATQDQNPKKRKILIAAGVVLGVFILAVAVFFLVIQKPNTMDLTPTPPADQDFYAQNFDDPARTTDWVVKPGEGISNVTADGGVYRFDVENGSAASILRGKYFTETVFTVEMEFLTKTPATAVLICRNDVGGYSFSIANDGHWKIDSSNSKLASGDTQLLQEGKNTVKIACLGSQLTFAINGTDLGAVTDADYPQGEIGLAVESAGKAAVTFDNLTVSGAYTEAEVPAKNK